MMSREQVMMYLLLSNQCTGRFFINSTHHLSILGQNPLFTFLLSSVPFQAGFMSSNHEKKIAMQL